MNIQRDNKQTSLFPTHVFTAEERDGVLLNNILIDWSQGHRDILLSLKAPEAVATFVNQLQTMSIQQISDRLDFCKNNSVLMTSLFLSGKCDAKCDICYTGRDPKRTIVWNEIVDIVRQVSSLGNRTIYVPGEGEPFLDNRIFDLMDLTKSFGQNLVLFTDGLLISDEKAFRKKNGFSLDTLWTKISSSNIYIYIKYWHSQKTNFARMMGIKPEKIVSKKITLSNGKSIDVPLGLLKLIEVAPEKAGIETAVHSRNFDDIFEHILPFVEEFKIKLYLEPIIHSGWYAGRHEYDLTPEQYERISPYLTKQQCKRTGFSVVVTGTGHLSFCPSFITNLSVNDKTVLNSLSIRKDDENKQIKDIYTILHSNRFLVESRYTAYTHPCLCEFFSTKGKIKQTWQTKEGRKQSMA